MSGVELVRLMSISALSATVFDVKEALRPLGFFRELKHGDPDGPWFHEMRDGYGDGNRSAPVRYLTNGALLAASGTPACDEFDPSHPLIGPLYVLTDGTWIWPSDLPYYVDRYGVALPEEFLVHAGRQQWTPPQLSHEDLVRITEEYLSG